MNPHVIVKRRDDGLLLVKDHKNAAGELVLTRLLMGVVPPTDDGMEAGYACVVGEIYDPDERQKSRVKILLDEAQALLPEDVGVDRDDAGHPHWGLVFARGMDRAGDEVVSVKGELPTVDDLRHAVVALKDLYHPGGAAPDAPMMAYFPPGANGVPFLQWLRATEGLCNNYPEGYDDHTFKNWWPFYRSRQHHLALSNEPPFGENMDFGEKLVDSLIKRGELKVKSHCPIWRKWELHNPRRAAGLVCAVMQHLEIVGMVREKPVDDGYGGINPPDEYEIQRAKRLLARQERGMTWMIGAR